MSVTQPIKEIGQIQQLKDYFLERKELRNYALIVLGLNTSLRISDMLSLCWKDIYNFKSEEYRKHIVITEQKTGKNSIIAINHAVIKALELYRNDLQSLNPEQYIFKSRNGYNLPITRNRAFNIIKNAVQEIGLEDNISCHSLRKTFGYQAWKSGVSPVLLMSIYNHSSFEITKRYLGISQDEKDNVFLNIIL